jgi:hypothetical protein
MARTQGTTTATDKNLKTSDNTTNNVSTSKHGFAPKSPNIASEYLDGTGNYSTPAGAGGLSIGLALMISKNNFNL